MPPPPSTGLSLLIGFVFLWARAVFGQGISGPTSAVMGQEVSYSFSGCGSQPEINWYDIGYSQLIRYVGNNYSSVATVVIKFLIPGQHKIAVQVYGTGCNPLETEIWVNVTDPNPPPPPATSCITITYSADRQTAYLTNNCSTPVCITIDYIPITNYGFTFDFRIPAGSTETVTYPIPLTAIVVVSSQYCN